MRFRLLFVAGALLLAGCPRGLLAQAPPEEPPGEARPPAAKDAEARPPVVKDPDARDADTETVIVSGERDRDEGGESEAQASEKDEEAAEEWARPVESGPPNRWLTAPPPEARQFAADYDPDLPDNPGIRPAGHAGELHGKLQVSLSPHDWAGAPRRLARPGADAMTGDTGPDQLESGVELTGALAEGRLDFSVEVRPGWRRSHYRLELPEGDRLADRVDPPYANRDYVKGWRRSLPYALLAGWSFNPGHRLTLRLGGAVSGQSGTLRPLGLRLDPGSDAGINTGPPPAGVPAGGPLAGAQGSRRRTDWDDALDYSWRPGPAFTLEAGAAWRASRTAEAPAADADRVLFIDNRRLQVYTARSGNGLAPLTTPTQYRFGGLGVYDGGTEARTFALHLQLTSRFAAAGAHELRYGLQLGDHRVRRNTLNSGPHGASGPLVFLQVGPNNVGNLDSAVRLPAGAFAEVDCPLPDPGAADFPGACQDPYYALVRGPLNPPPPLSRRLRWSAYASEAWTRGPLRLTLGLSYLRVRLESPVDYRLTSALTGNTLIGYDGFPVGTRDPDNPYESTGGGEPDQPIPAGRSPRYSAGPGRFTGGGYRFPGALSPRVAASWEPAGEGAPRITLEAARLYDDIPDELVHRAFGGEFGLARATFFNPDFTRQIGLASTYGGALHRVLPGTRLGYADHLRATGSWTFRDVRFEITGSVRRQGRILGETQASPLEEIVNFQYDQLIARRQCQNCGSGSVFPGYPAGGTAAARSFLALTLANPGDNTAPGLFGSPSRRDESLALSVRREAREAEHLSWRGDARVARARGNYQGVMIQANGSGEEKFASLFDYPLSPLTRSMYAKGPLDPDEGSAVEWHATWRDLGLSGLTAELGWRWRQGTLRTPLLRSPFALYSGLIPGTAPDYARFERLIAGYADLWVLRDYAPARRGALGRNPAMESWELALNYRRAVGAGTLSLRLEIDNLLNRTRPLSYEDALEPEPGYPEPVSSGPTGETLVPAQFAGRGPVNPAYGLPAGVQPPRQVRFGVEWSF